MKTYDIEVQRLKSLKHDRGLIEIAVDALVLPRPARDGEAASSSLRLPVDHARSLLIHVTQAASDRTQQGSASQPALRALLTWRGAADAAGAVGRR